MRVKVRSVGRIDIPKDRRIVLDHARLCGEDFSGRDFLQFCTIGCRLERCRFDNVSIRNAQFGSGREPSEFVECSFDGARLDGTGGYIRFVRCSFQNVDLRDWRCFEVEMIDCIFSGRMEGAFFNGTVRPEKRALLGREHNEFHGNDFSKMDLVDVGFRTGVDLTKQRLPSGPPYLYLPKAAEALERARAGLASWGTPETRKAALTFVRGLEEKVTKGQRQLFLRTDDYYSISSLPREVVDKVFSLLDGENGR